MHHFNMRRFFFKNYFLSLFFFLKYKSAFVKINKGKELVKKKKKKVTLSDRPQEGKGNLVTGITFRCLCRRWQDAENNKRAKYTKITQTNKNYTTAEYNTKNLKLLKVLGSYRIYIQNSETLWNNQGIQWNS